MLEWVGEGAKGIERKKYGDGMGLKHDEEVDVPISNSSPAVVSTW